AAGRGQRLELRQLRQRQRCVVPDGERRSEERSGHLSDAGGENQALPLARLRRGLPTADEPDVDQVPDGSITKTRARRASRPARRLSWLPTQLTGLSNRKCRSGTIPRPSLTSTSRASRRSSASSSRSTTFR